jgi:hypothetical protein
MKSIRPEIVSATNGLPGHGLLALPSVTHDALDPLGQIEILIQRNQDSRFLALNGEWSASQTWHQVDRALSSGDYVELVLGPGIIDPLVEKIQMTYLLQLRCGELVMQGVLRIREGILSSHAAGTTADPIARVSGRVAAATEATPVPPEQIMIAADDPPLQPAPQQKSNNLLWMLVIALVVALVAGYFIWNSLKATPPVSASSATQPPIAPTAAPVLTPPAPCSTAALAAATADLSFLQECLKTNPEAAQTLEVIEAAKLAKRCDLVQRLYAFKSQSGDAVVALAYAREFDPEFHKAGCIAAPDKATAIYWYELVLSKQPDNADAKARVQALKN